MNEPIPMCPRRAECSAYGHYDEKDPDLWMLDRWSLEGDKWPTGMWDPPRTCSFCGGVHPGDALVLLEAKWEIQTTTKSYKWYLEPPGTERYREWILENVRAGRVSAEYVGEAPARIEVRPPVKLYGQHCTPVQLEIFNAILTNRAVERGRW